MEKDFSFLQHLKEIAPDEQAYDGLDGSELWLFRIGDQIRGPYRLQSIQELVSEYSHELAPLEVCNVKDKIWKPFFDHSCFNARDFTKTLQLQPKFRKLELSADQYLCMINGVKRGPYRSDDIMERINRKELRADALISADNGLTWHRAYSYPQFDRRSRNGIEEESFMMPETVVESTRILTLEKLKSSAENDSLAAGVALLTSKNHHQKRQQFHVSEKNNFKLSNLFPNKPGKRTNPLMAIVLTVAFIALILYPDKKEPTPVVKDSLESLQNNSPVSSSKYEDHTPPKALETSPGYERVPTSVPQDSAPGENDGYMAQDDENTDPDSENDGREISSTRKKAKKIKVKNSGHEEVDPEVDESVDENYQEDESAQDFELTE